MYRYFLHLAYEGKAYCGWQSQLNEPSVQETIEKAMRTLTSTDTAVTGCGRTDTGVHSSSYYAHFDVMEEIEDTGRFVHQLNGILPDDIAVFRIYKVGEKAHARHDARLRTYRYYMHNFKSPMYRNYSWRLGFPLNHERIEEACRYLVGKRDYKCFAKTHSDVSDHICDIREVVWHYSESKYMFEISSNRFLRGMVRAIVGTLVDVGKGKMALQDFHHLIESSDRSLAGPSVPAHGLFLANVEYPYIEKTEILNFPFSIK